MNSLYWGEGGRFGPFDEQEDGWPNAGQVMRYFREKSNLSAETFALLYSKELEKAGKQNKRGQVTATWILNMEKQNLIPLDMERRRIIARLLHIPPVLLGLATLEAVTIQSRKKKPMGTLQKVTIDLAKHQKSIRDALHIHRTSSAKNLMQDVERDIWTLKDIEAQVRGDLLYQIQELLLSNFLLATRIMKDQRNYPAAYRSANEAVRVARQTQDNDLIATALYTRGCIKAEWARRGTVFNGMFQLDTGKMKSAAKDFQGVLQLEQETSIHPQLAGFTRLQLSRALAMLKLGPRDAKVAQALTMVDDAADAIDADPVEDFYIRALITGTLTGLHAGGYHLGRSETLNAAGLPGQALAELNQVRQLRQGKTYSGDETRYQAWFDLLMSETYMNLGDYPEATARAKNALVTFHQIHSPRNMASIKDIQSRLALSSYGTSIDVKELNDMLQEWYKPE